MLTPPTSSPPKQRTRGEKVVAFIERYCRAPEGDRIGELIRLEPFQRKFILEVYDNPYGTHSAYLSIARKNGKTSLIATLLLAHLVGPESVVNSQIVSGAHSKDQAAVIFELAAKIVAQDDTLRRLVKVHPSGKRLTGVPRNVLYRALAAEGKTAYGLSPILAILDEVGQVEGPRDKFITAITTAQGAYANPLLIAISTQAPSDNDLFSIWIDAQRNGPDPRVVSHIYEAPADCKLDDPKAWAAANPALGRFRSLPDVEKQAKAALEMPAAEADFRNLVLNQRVEHSAPFVARTVWDENNPSPGKPDGRRVWGGLDLSSVADLTALVLVDEDNGVHCQFWLPEDGIREKSRVDKFPYDLMAQDGLLNLTPGKAIEYEYIAEFMRGVFDRCNVELIGFDRYNMRFLKPWLEKAGFSPAEMDKFVEFGQGTQSMTPALRELEVRLLNRQLKHGGNPILNWCNYNARVIGESGARKFDKKKSRGRIDGMVALAMAVGVMPSAAEAEPKFQLFVV